jgi:threonine dehydratase
MPPTPQYRWPLLEAETGVETWVKHENHTPAGAFKVRGGIVYFDRLAREGAAAGAPSPAWSRRRRATTGRASGSRRAATGIPAVWWCRAATAARRTRHARARRRARRGRATTSRRASRRPTRSPGRAGWHRLPSFHATSSRRRHVRGRAVRGVPDLDTVYVPIGLGSGACGVLAARAAVGARAAVVGVVSAHAPAYAALAGQRPGGVAPGGDGARRRDGVPHARCRPRSTCSPGAPARPGSTAWSR